MATVYLAQDVKHKRKVALEILKPELAAVIGADGHQLKPQIPWLRVFVEGVVIVGSILLAFGNLVVDSRRLALERSLHP